MSSGMMRNYEHTDIAGSRRKVAHAYGWRPDRTVGQYVWASRSSCPKRLNLDISEVQHSPEIQQFAVLVMDGEFLSHSATRKSSVLRPPGSE